MIDFTKIIKKNQQNIISRNIYDSSERSFGGCGQFFFLTISTIRYHIEDSFL